MITSIRPLCLFLLCATLASVEPPRFDRLPEALAALDRALADEDPATLIALTVVGEPIPQSIRQDLLGRAPLSRIYADRQFPEHSQRFKLGGHARELGHIHIDFVRDEGGWQVERIWQCR